MKYVLLAIVFASACVIVTACSKDAIRSMPTDNPGVSLELLVTTPEGCKVYRFYDEYSRYVAVCPSQVSTAFDDHVQTGKTRTTHPEGIETARVRP